MPTPIPGPTGGGGGGNVSGTGTAPQLAYWVSAHGLSSTGSAGNPSVEWDAGSGSLLLRDGAAAIQGAVEAVTGTFAAGDGTGGTPTLTFRSASDAGFAWGGTSDILVCGGGAAYARWAGTVPTLDLFGADLVAAQAVQFSALGGGGTLMVVVDNAGVVGTQAIPGGGGNVTTAGFTSAPPTTPLATGAMALGDSPLSWVLAGTTAAVFQSNQIRANGGLTSPMFTSSLDVSTGFGNLNVASFWTFISSGTNTLRLGGGAVRLLGTGTGGTGTSLNSEATASATVVALNGLGTMRFPASTLTPAATLGVVARIPIPANCTVTLQVRYSARVTTGATPGDATFDLYAVLRQVAGVATVVTSTFTVPFNNCGAPTPVLAPWTLDTTNIELRVTGAAADDAQWVADVQALLNYKT